MIKLQSRKKQTQINTYVAKSNIYKIFDANSIEHIDEKSPPQFNNAAMISETLWRVFVVSF